jgi:hypothetical protein
MITLFCKRYPFLKVLQGGKNYRFKNGILEVRTEAEASALLRLRTAQVERISIAQKPSELMTVSVQEEPRELTKEEKKQELMRNTKQVLMEMAEEKGISFPVNIGKSTLADKILEV